MKGIFRTMNCNNHIIYQDILLLQDILIKSSMEGLFFAFYGDDTESAFEECKEEFYQLIMEEGDFPEFKDNKQFNVKLIKGKSVEKLLDETQERLTQNVIGRSDEDVLYPTMFLLIRENDDLLYKIRFLQKINYPLDQKRVDQILNGRYFLDVFGSSDLLIDGAIYHFCVLTVHSKVNLWKWITLMQEHKYIEHCYIDALSGNNAGGKIMNQKIHSLIDDYLKCKFIAYDDGYLDTPDNADDRLEKFALIIRYIEALGKSQGLAVDEAQKVLQYIHQINMQYGTDDMLCVGEIDEYYSDFANQLIDQYFSLLDIDIYNIDISYLLMK